MATKTFMVLCQPWTETEAGWGQRPDGFTLHLRAEDVTPFLDRMRGKEAKHGYGANNPPAEYSFPDGSPYEVHVGPKLYKEIKASSDGIWGPWLGSNHAPKRGTLVVKPEKKKAENKPAPPPAPPPPPAPKTLVYKCECGGEMKLTPPTPKKVVSADKLRPCQFCPKIASLINVI